MTNTEIFQMLPFILIEFLMAVIAVRHIITHKKYRMGDRTIWLVVTICIGYFGPLMYYFFGRERKEKIK